MRRDLADLLLHELGVPWTATTWQPRVDVYECKESVLIHIEAPGLDEDQLRLRYQPNELTVQGHKERPALPPGDSRCLQMEMQYGSFKRTLPLPADADGEHIVAHYVAGVLSISIPRRQPEPAARHTIRIN